MGHTSTTQNSVMPSVTTSTTPTYTVTPLNTSGFTLAIIQPIAPIFVQSLIQQGIPPEVLLSLFVKEIDLPNSSGIYRYVNDPDNTARAGQFESLIGDLVTNGLVTKTVDVLEPVGPTFDLHVASTATVGVEPSSVFYNPFTEKACRGKEDTAHPDLHPDLKGCLEILPAPPATPPASTSSLQQLPYPGAQINADTQGYSLVTTSGDAQYHVGNSGSSHGQLYRIYSGQFLMCVGKKIKDRPIPEGINVADHMTPHTDNDSARIRDALLTPQPFQKFWKYAPVELSSLPIQSAAFRTSGPISEVVRNMIKKVAGPNIPIAPPALLAAPPLVGGTPAAPSSPSGGGSGKGGASGSGNPAAGSSIQGTVPVLQAPRISAIVSGDSWCQSDQIVLPQTTDAGLQKESASFVHIYWRSLSDVFQYLGAVLRHDQGRGYPVKVFRDPTIQDGTNNTTTAINGNRVTLFSAIENGLGDLKVHYNSSTYAVATPKAPNSDFTKPILSIISTLVNVASQQNVSPSSAPIRLLPLP